VFKFVIKSNIFYFCYRKGKKYCFV